jgi:hypothetical protein
VRRCEVGRWCARPGGRGTCPWRCRARSRVGGSVCAPTPRPFPCPRLLEPWTGTGSAEFSSWEMQEETHQPHQPTHFFISTCHPWALCWYSNVLVVSARPQRRKRSDGSMQPARSQPISHGHAPSYRNTNTTTALQTGAVNKTGEQWRASMLMSKLPAKPPPSTLPRAVCRDVLSSGWTGPGPASSILRPPSSLLQQYSK